jgi:hypothetical protein
LNGYYLAADWGERRAWMIRKNAGGGFDVFRQDNLPFGFIVSFGQTENGEMLILASNRIYEVQANSTLPVNVTSFAGKYNNGKVELNWEVSIEDNIVGYDVEYSINGTFFNKAGTVSAQKQQSYSFTHLAVIESKLFYRLKMINQDGSQQYSKQLFLTTRGSDGNNRALVVPSVVAYRTTTLLLPKNYSRVYLIGVDGKEIWNMNIAGKTGSIQLQFPPVSPGHYLIKLVSATEVITQKILITN